MSHVTTHVLDTATGSPAAGIPVRLYSVTPSSAAGSVAGGALLGAGVTDADGRVRDLGPDHLEPGDYRLEFDVATPFLPRVVIEFRVADDRHYHVPVLLSPYGFTTYRGS